MKLNRTATANSYTCLWYSTKGSGNREKEQNKKGTYGWRLLELWRTFFHPHIIWFCQNPLLSRNAFTRWISKSFRPEKDPIDSWYSYVYACVFRLTRPEELLLKWHDEWHCATTRISLWTSFCLYFSLFRWGERTMLYDKWYFVGSEAALDDEGRLIRRTHSDKGVCVCLGRLIQTCEVPNHSLLKRDAFPLGQTSIHIGNSLHTNTWLGGWLAGPHSFLLWLKIYHINSK